jgi:oligosaccharyltransferase complex subunit alpha (ribophorin I)
MRLLPWITAVAWSSALCSSLAKASPSAQDWRVTNIVRTLELGGTVTTLSDIHVIRAPAGAEEPASDDDPARPYYFAFSQADASKISILEATVKFGVGVTAKQRGILPVQDEGLLDADTSRDRFTQHLPLGNESSVASRLHLYSVQIPAAYLRRAHKEEQVPDITIYLHALLLHASVPLPTSVAQTESQFLLWSGDASPVAVYDVEVSKVKVKSSHPRILSYTTTPSLAADQITKSGTTITFGPYEDQKSFLSGGGDGLVATAQVHYLHDAPVVSLVEVRRGNRGIRWDVLR